MLRRQSAATISSKAEKMITVSSNLGAVAGRLNAKLKEFQHVIKDKVARTVAVTELAEVKVRIHQEGKNAEDSPIGTYTNSYLKLRQHKPYNRTADPKVIFSLTRKMENEFVIIGTENGYGLGWLDAAGGEGKNSISNKQKSVFLEERFGKVYSLTSKEKSLITPIAELAVTEELSRLQLL